MSRTHPRRHRRQPRPQPARRRADRWRNNRRGRAEARRTQGAEIIDAGGCYVIPGGIDPHTHMELMFMGTVSADDFEWGTKAALSGGTTMIVDFCIPAPGASMLGRLSGLAAQGRESRRRLLLPHGGHLLVDNRSGSEMETVIKTYGINTFKHFMAYKGALMVNDDELYNSFSAALSSAPCRWFTPRTAMSCSALQEIF